jgi:hypothetical protein
MQAMRGELQLQRVEYPVTVVRAPAGKICAGLAWAVPFLLMFLVMHTGRELADSKCQCSWLWRLELLMTLARSGLGRLL